MKIAVMSGLNQVIILILCVFSVYSATSDTGNFAFFASTSQFDIDYLHSLFYGTNGNFWKWRQPITNTSNVWNFSAPVVNPCGGWQGVYCEAVSSTEGRIVNLVLENYNISGYIPSGISAMSMLATLALSTNMLRGEVPLELCSMGNLTFLDLSSNSFTGNVPSCFFQNQTLLHLSLSSNNLIGNLPNISFPSNLTFLDLEANLLSGTIPYSWNHLSSLETLYISDNSLHGNIYIVENFTRLLFLGVSTNFFDGSLPVFLDRATELRSLYLHENYLTGSLPDSWKSLTNIYYVSTYSNAISGIFSPNFSSWKSVVVITLDDNVMSGTLPPSISELGSLQQLTVYSNAFSGTIPPEFSKLSKLQLLLLQENLFFGNIESIFNGTLQKSLQTIDVSMNAFTGKLPQGAFVESMLSFSAFQTCFDGSIPTDICNARNLETLVLDGITSFCAKNIWPGIPGSPQFSSPVKHGIPECIWLIPNITTLHLSSNDLTGTIPSLQSYGNLTNLDLSFNRLVGSIPMRLQNWTKLMNLNLKNNRLVGEITGMNELQYSRNPNVPGVSLSLSNNRLSGIIPIEILHALDINIVDGNLFTCSAKHQPPYSDPNSANYVCASNMLDISLFCFMAAGAVMTFLLLLALYVVRRRFILSSSMAAMDEESNNPIVSSSTPEYIDELPNWAVFRTIWAHSNNTVYLSVMYERIGYKEEEESFPWRVRTFRSFTRTVLAILYWRRLLIDIRESVNMSYVRKHAYFTQFLRSVQTLRQIVAMVCLFVVIVTVPMFNFMKQDYGTYSNQFRWLISGAFFSGYPPAVAVLMLWFVALSYSVYMIDRYIPPEPENPDDKIRSSSLNSSSMMSDSSSGNVSASRFLSNLLFNSSDRFSSSSVSDLKLHGDEEHDLEDEDESTPADSFFQSSSIDRPPQLSTGALSSLDSNSTSRSVDDSSSSVSIDKNASEDDSSGINSSNSSTSGSSKLPRSALRQTIVHATRRLTVTVKSSANYWRRPSVWISIIALFLNIIVVVAIKAGFIYLLISSRTTFSFKVLIEVGLAAVDLTWSAILVPIIVNRLPKKRATGRMLLKTSMLYFNSIFAPCVVIAVVDTSCFNGLFIRAGQVEENFLIRYCYLLNPLNPSMCSQYESFVTTRYYTPLFIYNYDCYSTVITNYIPIFLISYTTLSLFVPLISVYVMSRWRPWNVFQLLPAIYKANSVQCKDPWLSTFRADVSPKNVNKHLSHHTSIGVDTTINSRGYSHHDISSGNAAVKFHVEDSKEEGTQNFAPFANLSTPNFAQKMSSDNVNLIANVASTSSLEVGVNVDEKKDETTTITAARAGVGAGHLSVSSPRLVSIDRLPAVSGDRTHSTAGGGWKIFSARSFSSSSFFGDETNNNNNNNNSRFNDDPHSNRQPSVIRAAVDAVNGHLLTSHPSVENDVRRHPMHEIFAPFPLRSRNVFFPAFILASAIHHLLVLLTFGLLCPSLAVAVAAVVCSTTWTWEIVLGRWMTSGCVSSAVLLPVDVQEERLRQLDKVCEKVCTSPRKCIWILCFGSALFFAFVLLDMAGDKQGWHGALWAPVWTMGLATLVWLVYICVQTCLPSYYRHYHGNENDIFSSHPMAGASASSSSSSSTASTSGGSTVASGNVAMRRRPAEQATSSLNKSSHKQQSQSTLTTSRSSTALVDSEFPANYFESEETFDAVRNAQNPLHTRPTNEVDMMDHHDGFNSEKSSFATYHGRSGTNNNLNNNNSRFTSSTPASGRVFSTGSSRAMSTASTIELSSRPSNTG